MRFKQGSLLLLFIFFNSGLIAQRLTDTLYHPNTKILRMITIIDGNRETILSYNYQGKLEKKEELLNRKLDGISTTYAPAGTILEETTFHEGKKIGLSKIYNQNGILKTESHFINDTLNGIKITHYENGLVQLKETYSGGYKIGKTFQYYKSGKRSSEYNYDTVSVLLGDKKTRRISSVQDGKILVWNESGFPQSEGTYSKGKKNGHFKEWYENGKLKEECDYVNDVKTGRQLSYHPNGNLSEDITTVIHYDSVKKYYPVFYQGNYLKYDINKKPLVKGFYKDNLKQGHWQEFSDGKLVTDSYYEKGFLVNEFRNYFPGTAQLRISANYKLVSRNGKDTSCVFGESMMYYQDGKVSDRIIYRDCRCVGSFKYYQDGVPADKMEIIDSLVYKTEFYKNGNPERKRIAKYNPSKDVGAQKYELSTSYYENGKIKQEFSTPLTPLLLERIWNDSGQVVSQQYRFQNDIRIETDFYNSGKLRSENIAFNSGQKIPGLQYLEWFENGSLKRFEIYSVYQINWLSDGSFFNSFAYDQYNVNLAHDTIVDPAKIESLYNHLVKSPKRELAMEHSEGRVFSLYDDSKVKIETNVEKGKVNGHLKSYFYSGNPMVDYSIKDGIPDGPFRVYLESGKLKMAGNYCMGKACGIWLECNANGDTLNYYEYEHPVDRSDYNNTRYVFKKEYFNSVYNGKFSKHMKSESNYKNGKLDGYQTEYNPNGTLNSRILMVEGKEQGLIKRFWEDGSVGEEYTLDSLGRKQGLFLRNTIKGTPTVKTYYKDNMQNGPFLNYWPNGKLYHKGTYSMDKRTGLWETFDSTGVKTASEAYINGVKEGVKELNFCGCKTEQEKPGFSPLLSNIMDIKRADIWQFGFHEPITKYLGGLFYIDYQTDQNRDGSSRFTSLDIISYKEISAHLPDNKGLLLVLNPCHRFSDFTRIPLTLSATENQPDETHLTMNPEMLAFRFETNLLSPQNKALKFTEAGFKVKSLEYSKKGIELNNAVSICFPPSFLRGTDGVISLDNFTPCIKMPVFDLAFPVPAFLTDEKIDDKNMITGICNGEGTLKSVKDPKFILPLRQVIITERSFAGIIFLAHAPDPNGAMYLLNNVPVSEEKAAAIIRSVLTGSTIQTKTVKDKLMILIHKRIN